MDEEYSFEKMIAAIYQAREQLKEVAPIMWTYFSALTKEGFSRKEALELTKLFQDKLFPTNRSK